MVRSVLPNATEIVWQAYYSIAHGAQGLMYFICRTRQRPDYPGLDSTWAGFRQVGDELFGDHGIAHALIAPSKTSDIMGEQGVVKSSNPNIHFIYKETKSGARVLMAVNMKQSEQEVTFTVPGIAAGAKPVHFENRTVKVADETVQRHVRPI